MNISDRNKSAPSSRLGFFRALSGRTSADPAGAGPEGLRGQLIAAFGTSRRDPNRPDTAAAAASLGVTQRTVQRWLATAGHQRQRPRASLQSKIATRARQAATTKRGRQRAIAATASTYTKSGMRLTISGVQGIEPGRDYVRPRTVPLDFDPELAQGLMAAYVDGGDAGAKQFISDNAYLIYQVPSWYIDRVDDIDVGPLYGG